MSHCVNQDVNVELLLLLFVVELEQRWNFSWSVRDGAAVDVRVNAVGVGVGVDAGVAAGVVVHFVDHFIDCFVNHSVDHFVN